MRAYQKNGQNGETSWKAYLGRWTYSLLLRGRGRDAPVPPPAHVQAGAGGGEADSEDEEEEGAGEAPAVAVAAPPPGLSPQELWDLRSARIYVYLQLYTDGISQVCGGHPRIPPTPPRQPLV